MATPAFFRKKPVTVSAMQFDGTQQSADEIKAWMLQQGSASAAEFFTSAETAGALSVETLEGKMVASTDDWIIRGAFGEFYPCKPNIFAATYEAA
jgi:hypothetical protein